MHFKYSDIKKSDFIFFLNANSRLVVPIPSSDVCFDDSIICTLHNGYYNKPYEFCTFEKRKESKAYVDKLQYKYYVGGRFFGAPTKIFCRLCKDLDHNISEDEKNNIMAEWHDESHLNWYVNVKCRFPVITLSTSYHIQMQYFNDFPVKKIVYLDKSNELVGISDMVKKSEGKIIKNKYNSY